VLKTVRASYLARCLASSLPVNPGRRPGRRLPTSLAWYLAASSGVSILEGDVCVVSWIRFDNEPEEPLLIPTAVAVVNGKGGTGKTSIVANVAGLAAAGGYRVLAVDLDPQANLARDLGYVDRSDGGVGLLAALAGHQPIPVLDSVRPGLSVIPGGEDLEDWAPLANARRGRSRQPETALYAALRPVASEYDLLLIDCPPGNRELQFLALVAARHVVIPTRPDEASFDGLVRVARIFDAVRPLNPSLDLLGVVLFGIETRAKRIRHEARSQVAAELGDPGLVFDSDIRHLLAPARDARARGQLAHEYEDSVLAAPRFYEAGGREERFASSAPGLASDYQKLTAELLTRLQASTMAVTA